MLKAGEGNPVGVSIDIKLIAQLFGPMLAQQGQRSASQKAVLDLFNALDKLYVAGGTYKENISQTHIELTTIDKNKNSLDLFLEALPASGAK